MRLKRKDIISALEEESLIESLAAQVELKRSWKQDNGKEISAIANHPSRDGGWLIMGVEDTGHLSRKDQAWLRKTEAEVSNHIEQYLSHTYTVNISGEAINSSYVILLEIIPIDDVVFWNDKAYKLVGTSSIEMSPPEVLELTLKLPGADYSKAKYTGDVSGALIFDFANKLQEAGKLEGINPKELSPHSLLQILNIFEKNVSGILFGDYEVRIARYDAEGDIIEQQIKLGLYSILRDDFIAEIQGWTKKQGTILKENSLSAQEEQPYPLKALREALANAVAHALYSKDNGNVLVELFPDRLCVANNCSLEAEHFANKWLSSENKPFNKLLMQVLRMANISDELGSGKSRIFRLMIESGKKEPIVEFSKYATYGRWKATLYNNREYKNLPLLISRLREQYSSQPEKIRLITAIILWRRRPFSEILQRLDSHYERMANEIKDQDEQSPFYVSPNGEVVLKRWVETLLHDGKVSKKLNRAEERLWYNHLSSIASKHYSGTLKNSDVRQLLGLSDSAAERQQISRLLKSWETEKKVELVKRGEWKFLNSPLSAQQE